MNTVRVFRTTAAAGAVALAVLGAMPSAAHATTAHKKKPTSNASSGAGAGLSYTGQATATGVHYSIDVNPPLFPVADLFDVQIPEDVSQLTSAGISDGKAAIATPGNAVNGLKLLCSLNDQLGQFCEQLNTVTQNTPVGPYPPSSPLEADASYPENNGKTQTATVSGKELGQKSAVTFYPGQASAQATQNQVTTTATGQSSAFAAGTPIAMSSGSVAADTHQWVKNNVLHITADASVHNVSIGGLVHIDSITSTAAATDDGKGHMTHSGSTIVSGVTALKQPATITDKGVQIGSQKKSLLGSSLNSTLQSALKKQGISIQTVGVKTTQTKRRTSVNVGGVLVNYAHNVTGLPDPSSYVPVCIPNKANCAFSAPDPNAKYIGIGGLGQVSVTAFAAPIPAVPSVKVPPAAATQPGSTTPGSAGSASTAGGAGAGGASPTVAGSGGASNGQSPTLAGSSASVNAGDLLSGTAHRLTYLFSAFLLATLAGFGGGLFRHPARLPVSGRE